MTLQTSYAARLSRADKALVARGLLGKLAARMGIGPAEPVLDGFIPQLEGIADRLDAHVTGKDTARAAEVAHIDISVKNDGQVDTWGRHIEAFLGIAARRHDHPFAISAEALHAALFPNGLDVLDISIPDENVEMRRIITVLGSSEHASTLEGIDFPIAWIEKLEVAVTASEAAYAMRSDVKGTRKGHVKLGMEAEDEWLDMMVRLHNYIRCRALASETAKIVEGQALLAPLTDAVAKVRVARKASATRRSRNTSESTAPTEPAIPPQP